MPADDEGRVRRITRQYERLEALELFRRIDRGSQTTVSLRDAQRIGDFITTVEEGLTDALGSEGTLHGWRIQALFEHLAASLGNIQLLKAEDSGECFFVGDEPKPPDFRVILLEGEPFLVEVKNVAPGRHTGLPKDFRMSSGEFHALRRYRDLAAPGWPIRLALYWARPNRWTLVAEEHLQVTDDRVSISFLDAMMRNEMVLLGDFEIATLPPLTLTLQADTSAPRDVSADQTVSFTIGAASISCAGTLLNNPTDQNLAMMFMMFGEWEQAAEAKMSQGKLDRVIFSSHPLEPDGHVPDSQPFRLLGSLSSLYSSRFNWATMNEGRIVSLTTPGDEVPELGVLIPEDYNSDELPLWRFHIYPEDHQDPRP